jgi:hypothetical protein
VPGETLSGAHIPNMKNERKKKGKKGSLPRWTPGRAQIGRNGPKFVSNNNIYQMITYFSEAIDQI